MSVSVTTLTHQTLRMTQVKGPAPMSVSVTTLMTQTLRRIQVKDPAPMVVSVTVEPIKKRKGDRKGKQEFQVCFKRSTIKIQRNHPKNAITLEKVVSLNEDDSFGFLCVVDQYGWQKIAQPQRMFSLDVVKHFFANSIATQEAMNERFTWVNGAPLSYNKYTINMYLGNSWNPTHEHGLFEYQMKINASYHGEEGHDEEYVRGNLCLEGLEPNLIGPV
ncbi:unnamed protein product [Lupinus luteus]|uniref:Uncharacterized protein n=1 Tax=Lupinus luteus TaxID=3873 RepID=A0AAV1XG50_LUPLU